MSTKGFGKRTTLLQLHCGLDSGGKKPTELISRPDIEGCFLPAKTIDLANGSECLAGAQGRRNGMTPTNHPSYGLLHSGIPKRFIPFLISQQNGCGSRDACQTSSGPLVCLLFEEGVLQEKAIYLKIVVFVR